MFLKGGASDLALVKLKFAVDTHPDYDLGLALTPIPLATEAPRPGDRVLTAGWGRTGYNQPYSRYCSVVHYVDFIAMLTITCTNLCGSQ